jgi:hypothetical protein
MYHLDHIYCHLLLKYDNSATFFFPLWKLLRRMDVQILVGLYKLMLTV